MENTFDIDYDKAVLILSDPTISEDCKFDIAEDFCKKYPFFDSSKFNKFFR